MEKANLKYIKRISIQSEVFSGDILSKQDKETLVKYFTERNKPPSKYKYKDGKKIKIKPVKKVLTLDFKVQKPKKKQDKETFSFFIVIYFYNIDNRQNFNITNAINDELDLIKIYKFLKPVIKSLFDLNTWNVAGLTIAKNILLDHDYSNYIEIIKNFDVNYSNLTINYDEGNVLYFYPNTSSRNPRDIVGKSKFTRFINLNKTINLKKKNLDLPENVLNIEIKLNKKVKDESILMKTFDVPKEEKLKFSAVLDDITTGSNKLNKYFNAYLKKNFFTDAPEILTILDKEKIFKYLEKKVSDKESTLYFIIAEMIISSEYKISKLKEIKKFIKTKKKNSTLDKRIKIIKDIKDNIRNGELTYTIAELYEELYDKIFKEEDLMQPQLDELDSDLYDNFDLDSEENEDDNTDVDDTE